jgi:hypothetical protein
LRFAHYIHGASIPARLRELGLLDARKLIGLAPAAPDAAVEPGG